MTDPKKFEKQFFAALRDIFVGAKVEGSRRRINTVRIERDELVRIAILPFPL